MDTFLEYDKITQALYMYGTFTTVWPLADKAGKMKILFFKIMWWIYVLNGLFAVPAVVRGISLYRNDFVNMMKSLIELTYITESIFNIFYCWIREKQLQNLLSEIKQSDKKWTLYEKIIRKQFMRCTHLMYTGMPLIFVIGALIFIFSPLVMPHRSFPLNTVYPFPITELWGWYIAYGLNVFTVIQATVTLTLDLIVITIVWNVTFKLNLLSIEMCSISTIDKLRSSIITHQSILRCVREIDRVISYLIIKLILVVSIYMISCSLLILNNVPFLEVTQFFLITFMSSLRLYACSWSAQTMTDMAYNLTWKIYDSPWIYAPPNVRRNVLMIIQNCQKSVVISATSVIPVVSINFCGKVFYTTFTYFMTLRAILHV